MHKESDSIQVDMIDGPIVSTPEALGDVLTAGAMIDGPITSQIKHKIGKKAPKLGGLREISFLSGCLHRRKEQIRASQKPVRSSGDKHYMVRRMKERKRNASGVSHERRAFRWWKYDFFKRYGKRPQVSFEDWWTVTRGGGMSRTSLMMYDPEGAPVLGNMYLTHMQWGLPEGGGKRVVIDDAEAVLELNLNDGGRSLRTRIRECTSGACGT